MDSNQLIAADLNLMPDPITLREENYDALRSERQKRVKTAMKATNLDVSKKFFLKEEELRTEKIHQQMEEGYILIDNHKLEVLLDDDATTRKNKDRQYLSKIIILQRAWKAHLCRKHLDDSDKISEKESTTDTQTNILSTPEANQNGNKEHFSLLRDKKSPMKQLQDTESDSVLSDYSEVTEALQDIADSELDIFDKDELRNTATFDVAKSFVAHDRQPHRLPGESDANFFRRVKKINFLSLAQEFAELKKINADASPYDSYIKSKGVHQGEDIQMNNDPKMMSTIKSDNNMVVKKKVDMETTDLDGKMSESGDFEVYNIETALPPIDWETIEQQIQLAADAATERKKETRSNDRETIRQKLAMGGEEEYYYNERAFKKPNFQTRLQSGMNLQICFMNEAMNEACHLPAEQPTVNKDSKLSKQTETSLRTKKNEKCSEKTSKENEDQSIHPSRLKEEAKIALAQASTMAHMQLEVEKQLKKKSPIADMVGIPSLGDGRRRKFNRKLLQEMNLAQLQVLVNDVHSQIENLNEELVHLLIERDDLHMEQDSMLVDVEDLTRYVSPNK